MFRFVWLFFQLFFQCNESNFQDRGIIKMRTQLNIVSFFSKNQEFEAEKEMEDEEFAVDMEEELKEELEVELKEDVEDEVEDTDWGPHEDSAPSTEDYSLQSEEEHDGIDSSNTVR